ncbi:MAG TPA: MBL fold metallo-hydrolase [Jatrophihabitans sp.]|nr:MBL fold metallo-hydrolase [Jatrophihabitans sp.]
MTIRITWWGHASATVEIGGVQLLTDPLLTARLAHLRRIGSPVPPAEATRPDVVLISHLHHDHLHLPSLRLVRDDAAVLVPAGGGRLLRADAAVPAARVHEVAVGDSIELGGVSVRAVPAAHDGRRLPGSRHRGPALGYLIEHGGVRVWFAGDTGLFAGLGELAPVDLALIPVGGWGPTLGAGHLDPDQAARAAELVQARHAVPIHYGTFWPIGLRHLHPAGFHRSFLDPGPRFARAAAHRCPNTVVHLLDCGASAELDLGP